MASTNKTEAFGLSQFTPNDDPSWYEDYNADMSILDSKAMGKAEYDPLGDVSEAGGIMPAITAAKLEVQGELQTHLADKQNPHGVTAAQTGAYSKAEVGGLLTGKADKTELAAKADQTALAAHIGNKQNPHGVTAAQINGYTKTEVEALLSQKANKEMVTSTSALVINGSGYVNCSKNDFGECMIHFRVTWPQTQTKPLGEVLIAQLPVEFRPKHEVYSAGHAWSYDGTGGGICSFWLYRDGKFTVSTNCKNAAMGSLVYPASV